MSWDSHRLDVLNRLESLAKTQNAMREEVRSDLKETREAIDKQNQTQQAHLAHTEHELNERINQLHSKAEEMRAQSAKEHAHLEQSYVLLDREVKSRAKRDAAIWSVAVSLTVAIVSFLLKGISWN